MFDSNTPRFFAPPVRADFAKFLDADPNDYFVAEEGGAVIGCGGVFVREGTGGLCWGMVERTRQRAGVGSLLLRQRLIYLREMYPQLEAVWLDTSQHSHKFFTRFGFKVVKVTPDAYAPGLDGYDTRLSLEAWARA